VLHFYCNTGHHLLSLQTYVFWNQHQPKPNEWKFEGVGNLTLFLEKAKQYGFFVNLRVGASRTILLLTNLW
jgi:beta-galactosidase GanA